MGNSIDYINIVISNQSNEDNIETIVTNLIESAELAFILLKKEN